MSSARGIVSTGFVHDQSRWVLRLRWIAGSTIILVGAGQELTLHLFPRVLELVLVGAAVLIFNLALCLVSWRLPRRPAARTVLLIAWIQIVFDLMAITTLAMLTGGHQSPMLLLYVLHMVLASILLPRTQAYAAAAVAIAMFVGAMLAAGMRPTTATDRMITVGWALVMLVTVHLTNHLMRELFERERARRRQHRRLRQMRRRLRRQQERMFQHDRLVSIGQLAAGVAHEISNPLASMDGLLQLMARKPDLHRPDAIENLREQVRRIQHTVRQLTTLAHPDLGQFESTDADQLIRNTLEMLAFDHRLRRVTVEWNPGLTIPVHVVPRALQQVLTNIVLNAVDAMSHVPEPHILIQTRCEDEQCVIEISDNGPGIPAALRERIFRPFYTTKPPGSGTGLGLAISMGLVRDHGGQLSVGESASGGARFQVRLPRHAHADAHSAHNGSTTPQPTSLRSAPPT